MHATLANRDLIDGDDNVQLILTPFVHGRHALMLAVNPFGVQEDGTITEGVLATGYNVAATGPPPVDLSADFVYESKGHLTSYGYEVVMRIPFRSIKYQQQDPQDWGLNIVRQRAASRGDGYVGADADRGRLVPRAVRDPRGAHGPAARRWCSISIRS